MHTWLEGKNIVIMGVANHRSIAWGIAQSLHKAGANLIFTYLGERLRENVAELSAKLGKESLLVNCDVTRDEEVEAAFAIIREQVGVIHGLAHCIAFAKTEELEGEYVNTSREGYALAQDISAFYESCEEGSLFGGGFQYLPAHFRDEAGDPGLSAETLAGNADTQAVTGTGNRDV